MAPWSPADGSLSCPTAIWTSISAKRLWVCSEYRGDDVVAMIDRDHAGRTTAQVVGLGGETPIVATLPEALTFEPDALLIGVATGWDDSS